MLLLVSDHWGQEQPRKLRCHNSSPLPGSEWCLQWLTGKGKWGLNCMWPHRKRPLGPLWIWLQKWPSEENQLGWVNEKSFSGPWFKVHPVNLRKPQAPKCHHPYSGKAKKGSSLTEMYHQPFLSPTFSPRSQSPSSFRPSVLFLFPALQIQSGPFFSDHFFSFLLSWVPCLGLCSAYPSVLYLSSWSSLCSPFDPGRASLPAECCLAWSLPSQNKCILFLKLTWKLRLWVFLWELAPMCLP